MSTNTAILKWDVMIQKLLIALNTVLIIATLLSMSFFLLVLTLQFFGGLYQIISSGFHLRFPHKSIGFRQYRLLHFWGGLAYVSFLVLIGYCQLQPNQVIMALVLLVIPQCILYSYFALCYLELKQLQHREFHILR